jgi:adenylate cyclase
VSIPKKSDISLKLRRDVRYLLLSGLVSAGVGSVIGGVAVLTLGIPLFYGVVQGIVAGTIIGTCTSFFTQMFPNMKTGRWIRELPFALGVALKSFVNFIIIILAIRIAIILVFPSERIDFDWTSPQLLISMAISGYLIISINFVTEVNRMLGQRVLRNFATGVYHHPQEENRIFLFIDVKGSTGIAERIGAIRFHAFLDHFFSDLSNAILQNKGEIHKYVGDEVIISWPFEDGRKGEPITCHNEFSDAIEEKRRYYEANFGVFPKFRAALHAGSVVSGELGDIKREIVFLGDTVNTAARMVDACKELEVDFVASKEALDIVQVEGQTQVRELGATNLRGREETIVLFELSRSIHEPNTYSTKA